MANLYLYPKEKEEKIVIGRLYLGPIYLADPDSI